MFLEVLDFIWLASGFGFRGLVCDAYFLRGWRRSLCLVPLLLGLVMGGREMPLLSFWVFVELCRVFEVFIGISFPSKVAMLS